MRKPSDFFPQAKDVGLHSVRGCRIGGASKAMYDPIVGKLKEIVALGVVMNGSRDEGARVGNIKPSRALCGGPGRHVHPRVRQAIRPDLVDPARPTQLTAHCGWGSDPGGSQRFLEVVE